MPQVVEWLNPSADDIVWRYPNETITWGAQLIVHETEVAVFFRDGKAYDVFGPGRHTITTLNLPLLTKVLSAIAGYGTSPFTATVIFVSIKQFSGKYGARAQTTELAPLEVFGSFWFRVENPQLFVVEIVGGQKAYTTGDVNNFIRGFINEKMIDELSKYDLLAVFTKLDETSITTKTAMIDSFKRLGLEVVDLKFEGIDTTPEYREKLFWIKTGRIGTDELLRMQTVKETAKELAKSPGAGVGTGLVLIPQIFQPGMAASTPAVALLACPSCKAAIPATSKFCPSCGTGLGGQTTSVSKYCSSCGHQVSVDSKFCPNCGAKQ